MSSEGSFSIMKYFFKYLIASQRHESSRNYSFHLSVRPCTATLYHIETMSATSWLAWTWPGNYGLSEYDIQPRTERLFSLVEKDNSVKHVGRH